MDAICHTYVCVYIHTVQLKRSILIQKRLNRKFSLKSRNFKISLFNIDIVMRTNPPNRIDTF